jgi:hypothetical protein
MSQSLNPRHTPLWIVMLQIFLLFPLLYGLMEVSITPLLLHCSRRDGKKTKVTKCINKMLT